MFNIFKKKEKKTSPPVIRELSSEEKAVLEDDIVSLKEFISNQTPTAEKYEELGLKQAELGDIEEAIISLENSLALKNSIGDGYKKLMSLYNQKRAESARNGDSSGIDYYMEKMDEMRQIARNLVVNRNEN